MGWNFTLLDTVHSPKGLGGQRGHTGGHKGDSILGIQKVKPYLQLPNTNQGHKTLNWEVLPRRSAGGSLGWTLLTLAYSLFILLMLVQDSSLWNQPGLAKSES